MAEYSTVRLPLEDIEKIKQWKDKLNGSEARGKFTLASAVMVAIDKALE